MDSRKDARIAKGENADMKALSERTLDAKLWFFLAGLAILARDLPVPPALTLVSHSIPGPRAPARRRASGGR